MSATFVGMPAFPEAADPYQAQFTIALHGAE